MRYTYAFLFMGLYLQATSLYAKGAQAFLSVLFE